MITLDFYNDTQYEAVIQLLKAADLYDETWETRENLSRKIARDPESIIVALHEGEVIGCVFVMEDGWNAFIWRLCVAETHRNKGVGTTLMRKAEEIVRRRGLKEVSLFVDVKNDSLKEWYQSQHYLQASDWTFMYKKLDN